MMNGDWINKGQISTYMGYKILLAGLSAAGKTSIKRIFFYKQQTTDVENLAATIDYERKSLSIANRLITIVDLGGQKVFIKRFLDKISSFVFSSVHILIFVIDVAAKSTRNDAIKYFSSCIEKLQRYSPNAEVFVFLHKNDLVRLSPNYESIHAQLKEQFQLQSPKKVTFMRTTIYDPKTVVDSFGRVFELAISEIAKSDYVDGRTIGEIEEYASKFAAVELQDACCPKCCLELSETEDGLTCNFCGYIHPLGQISESAIDVVSSGGVSVSIDDLQTQLQEILIEEETMEGVLTASHSKSAPKVTKAKNDRGVTTLDMLQSQLQDLIITEPEESSSTDSFAMANSSPQSLIQPVGKLIRPRNSTVSSPKIVQEEELEDPEIQIAFLTSFYGLKDKEAEQLVNSGYSRLFENTAEAGVPINLLLNFFLKYLPYLAKKGLNIKGLETKLIKVLFAHLEGLIKENEIFSSLIFAIKSPDMSIEEIVKNEIVKSRKEKLEDRPAEKPIEHTPISEAEFKNVEENIIPLSSDESIGFIAERVENNCQLTFYYNKQQIGNNLVSRAVSFSELKYLLTFEAKLPLKENYKEFAEAAASIILNAIEKLFNREKKTGKKKKGRKRKNP
ncbi:MAG: ADP-ribosylation factor-like protein [Candidatus Hermodarchaeota archaeon]